MISPPSATFSEACDRSLVVRTRSHPWGKPCLNADIAQKVAEDNRCMRAAFRIIHWLERHQIPWILEHPSSSKVWYVPRVQALRRLPHVQGILTDCCQFGSPWQKRTLLLCSRIDEQDLARCSRLCSAPPGWCSSGRQHVRLAGSNRHGVPLKAVAQAYPHKLCHSLAFALTAHARIVESL